MKQLPCIAKYRNELSLIVDGNPWFGFAGASVFFLEISDNEWLVYGTQFLPRLQSLQDDLHFGVLSSENGHWKDGQWICDRVLNGDEQYIIIESIIPQFYRLKWHLYK